MNTIKIAAKASYWSFLSEMIAKTVGPLLFLIMTRILSPEDFGIVAVATVILGFLNIVSDMGLSKVIIQEDGDDEYLDNLYNVAFWFNLVIGIFIFFVLYAFAGRLSVYFGQPLASTVIQVMSFQIILYSLSSVQNAKRKKKLDFKSLFFIRLLTVFVPALISIPLAFSGVGFWALVYGNLMGALASTVTLWYTTSWKPRLFFNFHLLRNMLSKGIWTTLESIFIWIPLCLDTILITKHLTSMNMGLYSSSRNLFTVAVGVILGPLIPVLFSTLSLIKNDLIQFRNAVLFSHKIIFTLSASMGVSVYIFRDQIEFIVFNGKWVGIGDILGLIFLIFGIEYFCAAISEALRAKGYFRIVSINTMGCTLISIPFLFISISHGIVIYTLIRGLLLFLQFPVLIMNSNKILDISLKEYLKNSKNVFVYLFFLLVFNYLFTIIDLNSIERLIYLLISYVIISLIFIFSERKNALYILGKIKKRI